MNMHIKYSYSLLAEKISRYCSRLTFMLNPKITFDNHNKIINIENSLGFGV